MDKLWENFPALLTLVGIVATAVWGPKAVAKIQGKQKAAEVKMEGDTSAEKMYVSEMKTILEEYNRQLEGYRKQVARYEEQVENLQKEFSDFKKQHQEEVKEYKEKIIFLEERVEELEDENETLKMALNERNEKNGRNHE